MRDYPIAKARGLHVSLESAPSSPRTCFIDPTKIMAQFFPTPNAATEVVVLSDAIDSIKSAAGVLYNFNTHPRDVSLVAVDAKALRALNVLLIRSTERQLDLGDPDGSEKAISEARVSLEIAEYVQPIAKEIRTNTATAENVYAALQSHPNPEAARRSLIGTLRTQSTVVHGTEILAKPSQDFAGKVSIPSREPQQLQVRVVNLDYENNCVEARLTRVEAPSKIFREMDKDVKMLKIYVTDSSLFFLIGQAAALGLPVSITAMLDLTVSAKGFAYTGSLVCIKNPVEFSKHLQQTANERARSLFD